MLRLGLVALLGFVIAVSSAAAAVDPRALVLGPAELPAGFRLDPSDSGVRSNAAVAGGQPARLKLFRRWGRLTGYYGTYEKGATKKIEVSSDLFRGADGARSMLRLTMQVWESSSTSSQTATRVALGDEGVVYSSSSDFHLVLWRRGRVVSGFQGIGLPRSQTLALARAQDRKIAVALR
jgi:hypothetical protein